jgi:hypothetical protein
MATNESPGGTERRAALRMLAAAAIGLWHGGSKVAVHHVCMWGLLFVLGMVGVELYRWRKSVGAGA